MARLAFGEGAHDDDDALEKSSTYSMFGQSMSNFNPDASVKKGQPAGVALTEENMDEYLERLLNKERERNRAANQQFFENNQALNKLRELEEEQINDLIGEEQWQRDLEDLKQMN